MTSVPAKQPVADHVESRTITQLVTQIVRRFNPSRIILFGSYAYGAPKEDSDVDLLIVMAHQGPGHRVATKIRLAVDVKFPMDLLVRSTAELRKGISQRDWFVVEILEKGIVLHDRANQAVGAKGRSRLRRRFCFCGGRANPAALIRSASIASNAPRNI